MVWGAVMVLMTGFQKTAWQVFLFLERKECIADAINASNDALPVSCTHQIFTISLP